jgi:hypothetical protein
LNTFASLFCSDKLSPLSPRLPNPILALPSLPTLRDTDERGKMNDDDGASTEEEEEEDLAGLPPAVLAARLVAARRLRREEARRRREAERRAEEDRALRLGTYYATVDQVWARSAVRLDRSTSRVFLTDLRRAVPPNFDSPDGTNYYRTTLSKAGNNGAYGPSRTARETSIDKPEVWPVDVFGTPNTTLGHVAHLVPASTDVATLYFDVVMCALGLENDGAAGWESVQMAIHGAKARPEAPRILPWPIPWPIMRGARATAAARRSARMATTTTSFGAASSPSRAPGAAPSRESKTGIKHSIPNMIRLAGQAICYDQHPGVLIVPALNLDQVKGWNGERYRAVVMVGEPVREEDAALPVRGVCQAIGMTNPTDHPASPEEVEVARLLLSQVVKGLAYSLKYRSEFKRRFMNRSQRNTLDRLRTTFDANTGQGVIVPAPNPAPPPGRPPPRVLAVQFRGPQDPDRTEHLAPDPWFLAAKAATNWSLRLRQPLLAAVAEPEPDDPFDDELHQLAREEYLERHDSRLRPPDDPKELALRLGQPAGYQGVEDDRPMDESASEGSLSMEACDPSRLDEASNCAMDHVLRLRRHHGP